MKTRTDFVSNSSSCSFVVTNPSQVASSLDSRALQALSACKDFKAVSSGKFPESLKARAQAAGFRLGAAEDGEPECMYCYFKEDPLTGKETKLDLSLDLLEEILENSSEARVCVSYDTYDDIAAEAASVAALFDYAYKADIDTSDCDHWYYTSYSRALA